MMKLFLAGGGDKEQTEIKDNEFIKNLNSDKPLLYISVAMDGEIPYEDCYKWINSLFNPLGIIEIEMWTDLKDKSIYDLNQFSSIYIGGGNTFHLLNTLRETWFDKLLMEFINKTELFTGEVLEQLYLGAIFKELHIWTQTTQA